MDVAGVGGELVAIQVGPHGGFAVEGTFDVVGLVREHFADANDEVGETFGGGPMVSDADRGRLNVRMEDRCEHSAFGALPWIVARQLNFHLVLFVRNRLAAVASHKAADAVLDDVEVGRISRCR